MGSHEVIPLSGLDTSPVPSGAAPGQGARNSIDLARHLEEIGFHRYWVAEHHNAGALGSAAPEIMIAAIAAATRRIRVGSGGVMLPNHSPLKVAEVFRLLAALHPSRIDLGVGRAAGTDNQTALALRQAKELLGAEQFPDQLDALLAYLAHEPDPAVAFGPIKAVPIGIVPPPVFVLGTGTDSAELAGRLGLGFAFNHAFSPEGTGYADALRAYRDAFVGTAPHAILAVSVICAADASAAEELGRAGDLGSLRFGQGLRDLPFPSVAEARAYTFDADEERLRSGTQASRIAGEPSRVRDRLLEMIALSGADELIVTTGIHDHEERKRSFDRLVAILA